MRRAFVPLATAAVGIIVGCAAAPFIVPPVRAGSNPQKWEYACPRFFGFGETDKAARSNKLGAQGWELVTTDADVVYCFKRPLP